MWTYNITTGWVVVLIMVAIWELYWKGMALWRASKRDDTAWFVSILIFNTAGILPMIYILWTAKQARNIAFGH